MRLLRRLLACLACAAALPAAAQAPAPPAMKDMAAWMAGTVMCLVVEGRNSDGTTLARLPQGSGFLVNEFGYLLTNSHVVRPQAIASGAWGLFQPTAIRGSFVDGECERGQNMPYTLEVVAFNDHIDLALLKVRDNVAGFRGGWRYLPRRDSNLLQKSEAIVAVGFPDGVNTHATLGTVAVLDRSRARIETDLRVRRGFSGGPVLDLRGYVVGVVWGGLDDASGTVNHFIPINHAKQLLQLAGDTP